MRRDEAALEGSLISIAAALSANEISSRNKELGHAYFTFREPAGAPEREKLTEGTHKRAKLFNKISSHGRKFPRSSRLRFVAPCD